MGQSLKPKEVIIYSDSNGKEPFTEWLSTLKASQNRRRILQRITRLKSGNRGDFKSLKSGIYE